MCLTAGDTITVTEGDKRFYLDVLETKPEDGVCVIETDCEVDFVTPLDDNNEPVRFTGVAARMDGKPVEQPKPPAPVSKPTGGLRFGGAAAGGVSKGKKQEGGSKEQEQRFTGTAYSLQ